MMGQQQMMNQQQMMGQLAPADFNPNLFQTMAPPMNYKYFNGDMIILS